ncbi:hypothetical protein Tco_0793697 [Tanacetum coccineum]
MGQATTPQCPLKFYRLALQEVIVRAFFSLTATTPFYNQRLELSSKTVVGGAVEVAGVFHYGSSLALAVSQARTPARTLPDIVYPVAVEVKRQALFLWRLSSLGNIIPGGLRLKSLRCGDATAVATGYVGCVGACKRCSAIVPPWLPTSVAQVWGQTPHSQCSVSPAEGTWSIIGNHMHLLRIPPLDPPSRSEHPLPRLGVSGILCSRCLQHPWDKRLVSFYPSTVPKYNVDGGFSLPGTSQGMGFLLTGLHWNSIRNRIR